MKNDFPAMDFDKPTTENHLYVTENHFLPTENEKHVFGSQNFMTENNKYVMVNQILWVGIKSKWTIIRKYCVKRIK